MLWSYPVFYLFYSSLNTFYCSISAEEIRLSTHFIFTVLLLTFRHMPSIWMIVLFNQFSMRASLIHTWMIDIKAQEACQTTFTFFEVTIAPDRIIICCFLKRFPDIENRLFINTFPEVTIGPDRILIFRFLEVDDIIIINCLYDFMYTFDVLTRSDNVFNILMSILNILTLSLFFYFSLQFQSVQFL